MPDVTRRWVPSMRLRITIVAASITAIVVAIAGWLLIRSVEDTQLANVRDNAEQSLDTVAERLGSGDPWDEALIGLSSVVVVTDDTGDCIASNPAVDRLVFRCGIGGVPESEIAIGGAVGGGVVGGTRSDPDDGDDNATEPADESGRATSELAIGGPIYDRSEEPADDMMSTAPVPESVTVRPALGPTERLTTTVDTDAYGALHVTALAPDDTVVRGLESAGPTVWFLFPGLVILAAGLAWWLTGRTLRPVEAIRREAEEIEATSLHRRLPQPPADDEIGRLAHTMNAMLERLDRSARQQRQFISDASHELRSPVAAIRTDLEVALEEADPDWPTTARAALAEEARLDGLIGDLLILAADDEGGGAVVDDKVDLELVVTAAATRRRRLPTRVTVGFDRDDAATVRGSAARLERALANLVDNAARHADARVEVTLTGAGSHAIIHVDDDGPGIAVADRERVFERFTRLDESRARDQGGAGLGLAVARTIVEHHGGTLEAAAGPMDGARFTMSLPHA